MKDHFLKPRKEKFIFLLIIAGLLIVSGWISSLTVQLIPAPEGFTESLLSGGYTEYVQNNYQVIATYGFLVLGLDWGIKLVALYLAVCWIFSLKPRKKR